MALRPVRGMGAFDGRFFALCRVAAVKDGRKRAFAATVRAEGRASWAPRGDGGVVLYGWHTVTAALADPARRIRRLLATENAVRRLADDGIALPVAPELVRPDVIAARLSPDAVHQGLLAEADPLPSPALSKLAAACIVVILDQITDPHNVGAILRTAAAFAVGAVVTTARHSPEATGVLAKSASGALELVPIVTVQNLARAIGEMKSKDSWLSVSTATRPTICRRCSSRRRWRCARRRRQRLAARNARRLRSARPAQSSRRDQKSERVERGRARALYRQPLDRRMKGMIPKKRALDLIRGGNRFSEKITLESNHDLGN